MTVAKGEGVGGKSLPIGEGVLGGNWRRTHCLLYKTLLGAPAEGCVQEEGEGPYLARDHLPRGHGYACSHARHLEPVRMATECSHATGHHRGGAVWLPPRECCGPQCSYAGDGACLCVAWGLIYEGSILAYNPARDEVEWVPTCRIANNLSWVEERMVVTLANFVPCVPQESHTIIVIATQDSTPSGQVRSTTTPTGKESVTPVSQELVRLNVHWT